LAKLTYFIDKEINAMLSPDITLSCQLIQSMTYALRAILVSENAGLLKEHQARISNSITKMNQQLSSLEEKLKEKERDSSLTGEDKQQMILLQNIKLAIKEVNSALSQNHIPSEKTERQEYVDRLLQGCALLMQATDVGVQWYGAVATFGVSSP